MAINMSSSDAINTNYTSSVVGDAENSLERRLVGIYIAAQPVISGAMIGTGIAGFVGNVLTLVVFARMGFQDTINMSYAALAISDLFCVLTAMAAGIARLFLGIIFAHYHLEGNMYLFIALIAGWPHITFSRTTSLLTAWISLERCLCVLLPTKVKLIITPRVTKAVLAFIFTCGCGPAVLFYTSRRFRLHFDPEKNFTVWSAIYDDKKDASVIFTHLLYSNIYPIVSWIVVTVCTTFLIIRLQASVIWRQQGAIASGRLDGNTGQTAKEARLIKTVVCLAAIFLLSSLPLSVSVFAPIAPNASNLSRSLLQIISLIGVFLSQFNSSTNIIVYCVMGRRFRTTLLTLNCISFLRH